MSFGTRRTRTNRRALGWLIVLLLYALMFSLIFLRLSDMSDYGGHIQYALAIAQGQPPPRPHILYHLLLIASVRALGLSFITASVAVVLMSALVSAALVYGQVRRALARSGGASFKAIALTLGLMVAAPIAFTAIFDGRFYLGFIGIAVYHNPTALLLKPLSLLLLLYVLAVLDGRLQATRFVVLAGAVLTLLCAWAKPNFIVCLLPALVLVMLVQALIGARDAAGKQARRRQPGLLGAAVFLPALLSLAVQFWLGYALRLEDSSIAIAPFYALQLWEPSLAMLALKFVLSAAFPLLVLVLYWRDARRSLPLVLCWLAFAFGVAQMYLLAETGVRAEHGNWWWGAQVTLWLLFIFTAIFLIGRERSPQRALCWAVFALHVAFGVLYYGVIVFKIGAGGWT